MQLRLTLVAPLLFLCCDLGIADAEWLAHASTYTHDPVVGRRVNQYEPISPPTAAASQPVRTSGYTHIRSSLNYGQSADNYHRVQTWGDPVRPYGEWRFPFRPYSTPYPNWGAPLAGLGARVNIQSGLQNNLQNGVGNDFGSIDRPGRGYNDGQLPPFGNQAPRNPRFPGGVGGGGILSVPPDVPYAPLPNPPERSPPFYDGYHPVYRD